MSDCAGNICPFPMVARGSPALEDLERRAAAPVLILTAPSQSATQLILQVYPSLTGLQVPAMSPASLAQLLASSTSPAPTTIASSISPAGAAPTVPSMVPLSELGQSAITPKIEPEPSVPAGPTADVPIKVSDDSKHVLESPWLYIYRSMYR